MQEHILECLRRDSTLRPLIETLPFPSLPSSRPSNPYEDLIRSIVGQQLSVKAAQTIYKRFTALFHEAQPDPRQLLGFADETLLGAGLSKQKLGYIRNVTRHFEEHGLYQQDWGALSDEAVIQTLTAIKGVGIWTVQMLLMFSLGRPDVFPAGDLGIQTAMRKLYALDTEGKTLQKQMAEIAESWRPYRSYSCYYLWAWKDQG